MLGAYGLYGEYSLAACVHNNGVQTAGGYTVTEVSAAHPVKGQYMCHLFFFAFFLITSGSFLFLSFARLLSCFNCSYLSMY